MCWFTWHLWRTELPLKTYNGQLIFSIIELGDVRAKGRAFSFQIEFGVKYRVILLSLVPFWVFLTFFSLIWRWFGWCYCFVPSFKQQFNYVTHVIFSFYYLKLVYLLLTLKIRFVQEFSHFWSVILKFNCDLSVCIGSMTVHSMTSLVLGPLVLFAIFWYEKFAFMRPLGFSIVFVCLTNKQVG